MCVRQYTSLPLDARIVANIDPSTAGFSHSHYKQNFHYIIASFTMGAKPTKPATPALTTHQWLYMVVMNGVGAMILNGSINCALAYVTNLGTESVSVWSFDPSPLAGDIGVTILIQQMLTWLIAGALVSKDVRNGAVAPLGSNPPRILRTKIGSLVTTEDLFKWDGFKGQKGLLMKLKRALPRALVFTVVSFVLYWPITVLILSLIYNADGRFSVVPDCLIIKAVFGGLLSWTTPFVAYFALRTMGRKLLIDADSTVSAGSPRVSVVVPGGETEQKEKLDSTLGTTSTMLGNTNTHMLESTMYANRTIV